MTKKSFFRKLTVDEMKENLDVERTYRANGLVEKIWNLDAENDALELRFPIIPLKFLGRTQTQAGDSRKNFKHGSFLKIDQPQTQREAYESESGIYTPLIGRMRTLDRLRESNENEIDALGISWKPIQGNDRVMRVIPFEAVIGGVLIYNYSLNRGTGIEVETKYTDANIVGREGGQILCRVPSMSEKKGKYAINFAHVPLIAGREENAVVLSLRANFQENEPLRQTYYGLRYASQPGNITSDRLVFGPHEIAAYLSIIRDNWRGFDSTVPLRMNPFPLPSKKFFEYGLKLDSNVMIYDPTLKNKKGDLRNLHLDEKCILLGRAIGVKGVWETVYWDLKRDGKISEYKK